MEIRVQMIAQIVRPFYMTLVCGRTHSAIITHKMESTFWLLGGAKLFHISVVEITALSFNFEFCPKFGKHIHSVYKCFSMSFDFTTSPECNSSILSQMQSFNAAQCSFKGEKIPKRGHRNLGRPCLPWIHPCVHFMFCLGRQFLISQKFKNISS